MLGTGYFIYQFNLNVIIPLCESFCICVKIWTPWSNKWYFSLTYFREHFTWSKNSSNCSSAISSSIPTFTFTPINESAPKITISWLSPIYHCSIVITCEASYPNIIGIEEFCCLNLLYYAMIPVFVIKFPSYFRNDNFASLCIDLEKLIFVENSSITQSNSCVPNLGATVQTLECWIYLTMYQTHKSILLLSSERNNDSIFVRHEIIYGSPPWSINER